MIDTPKFTVQYTPEEKERRFVIEKTFFIQLQPTPDKAMNLPFSNV